MQQKEGARRDPPDDIVRVECVHGFHDFEREFHDRSRGEACCLRNFFAPSPQPPEEMQAATLRSTPAAYTATAAPKLCPTTPMRFGSTSGRPARNDSAFLVSLTCSLQMTRPRSPSLSPQPRKSKRSAA